LANFNKKVTPWILSLIIKELSSELETNFDPLELLQKTVKIATRIFIEYFENIGSPRRVSVFLYSADSARSWISSLR
jgi:hypothetical protein